MMNRLKSVPFYTFLLALFFCLHGAAENFGFISAEETLKVFLQIFLFIWVVFLPLWLKTRSVLHAGLLTFFLVGFYIFFGVIKAGLSALPLLKSYTAFAPVMLLIFISVIVIIGKNKKTFPKITLYLNILFIAYCLFDALILFRKHYTVNEETSEVSFDVKSVKASPNIYLLLFDEYAGYESLDADFNFKNDSFYNRLRSDSFTIIPSSSNYPITAFSMASFFNMEYLQNVSDSSVVGWKQTQECVREIKNGKVFSIFKKMGYDVKSFSLFDAAGNKSLGANQFVLGHERVITDKMFHNVIIRELGWHLVIGKYARPFMQRIFLADMPQYNDKIETGLTASLSQQSKPKFVYCHFLMPHTPFLRDSLGGNTALDEQFTDDPAIIKNQYFSYLKYCNKKIPEYVARIIESDPDAMIILLSDHGFRDVAQKMPAAAFNNFCAVRYLPGTLTFPETISNVNIFRFVFNNCFGQHFKNLPDRTFFLTEKP